MKRDNDRRPSSKPAVAVEVLVVPPEEPGVQRRLRPRAVSPQVASSSGFNLTEANHQIISECTIVCLKAAWLLTHNHHCQSGGRWVAGGRGRHITCRSASRRVSTSPRSPFRVSRRQTTFENQRLRRCQRSSLQPATQRKDQISRASLHNNHTRTGRAAGTPRHRCGSSPGT